MIQEEKNKTRKQNHLSWLKLNIHTADLLWLFFVCFYLPGWFLLTLFDLLGLWCQKVVGKSKSIGSALSALPKIARHLKPSDSTDTGLLDNKDGGIHCRQGVPCLESLFLSHSAVSNSGQLYLIFRFLSSARSYFNSGEVENATEMSDDHVRMKSFSQNLHIYMMTHCKAMNVWRCTMPGNRKQFDCYYTIVTLKLFPVNRHWLQSVQIQG